MNCFYKITLALITLSCISIMGKGPKDMRPQTQTRINKDFQDWQHDQFIENPFDENMPQNRVFDRGIEEIEEREHQLINNPAPNNARVNPRRNYDEFYEPDVDHNQPFFPPNQEQQ